MFLRPCIYLMVTLSTYSRHPTSVSSRGEVSRKGSSAYVIVGYSCLRCRSSIIFPYPLVKGIQPPDSRNETGLLATVNFIWQLRQALTISESL